MQGKLIDEAAQVVRVGDGKRDFFQDRFQIFFGGLLTQKTNVIMRGREVGDDFQYLQVVGFCLSNPRPGRLLHIAPFPCR